MSSSRNFSSISAVAVVLILTIGVFMGVLLVSQEQDIREKAKELKEHKVVVCHKTGSGENPWVEIEISEEALEAHLEHGDIRENCPKEKKEHEDKEHEPSATQAPSTGGINLATNVTVINQTINPQPTPETKYVYITTRFDFWIKFQGIDENLPAQAGRPDKEVRVIFRKGQEELHVYNKVVVASDSKGIYRGTITDVRPGTYEVLIKDDSHLQKKFENVVLVRGRNFFNWSKEALLAGDFDSNNILEAKDVANLMSFYTQEVNPVGNENISFDVDLNGYIDSEDIRLVLSNFKSLQTEGDN